MAKKKAEKMLHPDREQDLDALFEHIFDTETEDFYDQILNEEYFVEEGILTEEGNQKVILNWIPKKELFKRKIQTIGF